MNPGKVQTGSKFQQAMARIDAENAQDPRVDRTDDGQVPRELLYARRMSERLASFAPDASEDLQLAARCQHIRRWDIPRDSYPAGRTGYRRWRTALADHHAATAARILREVGYEEAIVERVGDLVRKRRLKKDEEAQTLEDVVCLVFLEYYFEPFAADYDDEKLVDIVRKTWVKMSDRGRSAALALALPPRLRRIMGEALRR